MRATPPARLPASPASATPRCFFSVPPRSPGLTLLSPELFPPPLLPLSHSPERSRSRATVTPRPPPPPRPLAVPASSVSTSPTSSTSHDATDALQRRHHHRLHRHGRRSPPLDSQQRRRPRAHQPLRSIRCELLRRSPPSPGTFSPANANIHQSGELTAAVVPCRRGQGHRSPRLSTSPCSVNPQEHVALLVFSSSAP